MMKKILLLCIVIGAIVVSIGILRFNQKKNRPSTKTIEVSGITINNPWKNAVDIEPGEKPVLTKNEKYRIVFQPKYNLVLITILATPYQDVRKEAEQDLLNQLGVSKEEACKLNVSVGSPYFANKEVITDSSRLSFCSK